jgi:hypothetical protein
VADRFPFVPFRAIRKAGSCTRVEEVLGAGVGIWPGWFEFRSHIGGPLNSICFSSRIGADVSHSARGLAAARLVPPVCGETIEASGNGSCAESLSVRGFSSRPSEDSLMLSETPFE